jgi:hypothetical protein
LDIFSTFSGLAAPPAQQEKWSAASRAIATPVVG